MRVLKKVILKNQCCKMDYWQRGLLSEGHWHTSALTFVTYRSTAGFITISFKQKFGIS